ncbi:MAG: diguanylate cyclase, partial [Actinomycetota bacterium]|nr:diguanylate cyclase [Actinomycetota bacterium]
AALAAPMVSLARRCSLRETGVLTFHGISTELVLAALGVGVAFLWVENPWLVPFALAPLFIVHRSLSVPLLEAEARVDPKTGLFNARHFQAVLQNEFARAERFDRPLAVVMADIDLLREVNNTYGHLAGDAALRAVADVFRAQLRHYDVPARFGGEELAIVLPETDAEEAAEIAERIRRSVAAHRVVVETSADPIAVTISIGVAAFPADARQATELVHKADLAVYRAKLQGRNRVVRAGADAMPVVREPEAAPEPVQPTAVPGVERAPTRSALLWTIGLAGIAAGALGMMLGREQDLLGMLAVAGIVALVQVLADDLPEEAASVNAVGILAAAALFGPRVALALAAVACAVAWGRTRMPLARLTFDIGTLTLAALGASAAFAMRPAALDGELVTVIAGVGGGLVYFVAAAVLPIASANISTGVSWRAVWRALPESALLHYLAAGLLAAVVAIAYDAAGLWTLALLVVPLLLARSTQDRHAAAAGRTAEGLRVTVRQLSARAGRLEQENAALRSHSTALMEAVANQVDAREAVGHSRDVQALSLAIGRRLGLSEAELELLGHAALFHDVGKLAVPDAVLLKHDALTDAEWALLRPHAEEGADLVEQLAFLEDAVPAIRHHHERYDGTGYPDGLSGDDIPLGARIIHVAESVVSMLEGRRGPARAADEILAELRRCSGTQFCPRCVDAFEGLAASGFLPTLRARPRIAA